MSASGYAAITIVLVFSILATGIIVVDRRTSSSMTPRVSYDEVEASPFLYGDVRSAELTLKQIEQLSQETKRVATELGMQPDDVSATFLVRVKDGERGYSTSGVWVPRPEYRRFFGPIQANMNAQWAQLRNTVEKVAEGLESGLDAKDAAEILRRAIQEK